MLSDPWWESALIWWEFLLTRQVSPQPNLPTPPLVLYEVWPEKDAASYIPRGTPMLVTGSISIQSSICGPFLWSTFYMPRSLQFSHRPPFQKTAGCPRQAIPCACVYPDQGWQTQPSFQICSFQGPEQWAVELNHTNCTPVPNTPWQTNNSPKCRGSHVEVMYRVLSYCIDITRGI